MYVPWNMHHALKAKVEEEMQKGWTIESCTDMTARLTKGHENSHTLHLILSLLTCGIWIPVWIFIAITTGKRSRTWKVDKQGRVRNDPWA
jgi:hypothetical protein